MDPSWDSYGFRKKKRRSNDAALCKKNPLNVAAKKNMGGEWWKLVKQLQILTPTRI